MTPNAEGDLSVTDSLHVGLDSWIIQDGNYADFQSGAEYRFALEFYPHALAPAPNTLLPQLRHRTGGVNEVQGTVLHCSDSAWVVDFGVPAFNIGTPPEWATRPGQSIVGLVHLGVDPYFYKEDLRNRAGMPDLFRRWRVLRILLETTPWVQTDQRTWCRDHSQESFREVATTNAWDDDDGNGHYVLECTLLRSHKAAPEPH